MHAGAFQSDTDQLLGGGFDHARADLPVVISINRIVRDADTAAEVAQQGIQGGSLFAAES